VATTQINPINPEINKTYCAIIKNFRKLFLLLQLAPKPILISQTTWTAKSMVLMRRKNPAIEASAIFAACGWSDFLLALQLRSQIEKIISATMSAVRIQRHEHAI